MKRIIKILVYVFVGIIAFLGIGLGVFLMIFPKMEPPPDLSIELTPERLERGKYLYHNVSACDYCHGMRDWSLYSVPVIPGSSGGGGMVFGEDRGMPGIVHNPNITPFALKDWTDGEIARAITSGIGKKDQTLFPFMAYPMLKHLGEEDLYSLIAYIRTLKPIEKEVPDSEINPLVEILVRTYPDPYVPKPVPQKGTLEYGRYLTVISACVDCHTDLQGGGPELAGGQKIPLPGEEYFAVTPNLTPDPETGLKMSKEAFVQRFLAYRNPENRAIPIDHVSKNTVMPWTVYSGMKKEDLESIYDYLRTLKPLKGPKEWGTQIVEKKPSIWRQLISTE